jgi:heterodisulfide reductase subunit A
MAKRNPNAEIVHYVRTIVAPGAEARELLRQATQRLATDIVSYDAPDALRVEQGVSGNKVVSLKGAAEPFDLVLLLPPSVPASGTRELAARLDLETDSSGFFEELHGRVDATRTAVRGVYVAGACRAPADLGQAMTEGSAAAGHALSALVPGRELSLEAIHATVDDERCSGCRTCVPVCPYSAISFDEARRRASVDAALCTGCGTCVAACPSAAMQGRHFTNQQLFAEIEAVLR